MKILLQKELLWQRPSVFDMYNAANEFYLTSAFDAKEFGKSV